MILGYTLATFPKVMQYIYLCTTREEIRTLAQLQEKGPCTIPESEEDGPCHHESFQEGANPFGDESSQEDDEGLFIPSYLEEALPDDPVLQVKMAHAMWVQEVETRRCFTCNQQDHLQRDHWKYEEKNGNRPLQPKGPPLNKSAQERVKTKPPPPGQNMSQINPPK